MKNLDAFVRIFGLLLTCSLAISAQDEVLPRALPVEAGFGEAVTSNSGQFRVRGGEAALRGSVALLAEQTRAELLRLTEEPRADYKIPVHIQLINQTTKEPPPKITFHDGGYELRLSVHTGRGFDVERFQNAVSAALVYERSLENRSIEDTETTLLVQPWLLAGLREATRWQIGLGDRRHYETLFRSGGVFKLDDLFTMTDAKHESLDAASRAAFTVSSGALVMALLEQPDGTKSFRKFLTEVAQFAGEMPTLLRRHFPEMNLSENSMEKWWQLLLAHKGTASLTESLSIFETETALNDALKLHFRDEDGGMREESIEAWPELLEKDSRDRAAATRMAADTLVRLSYRCFPSYRPLLASYQEALMMLSNDQTRPETIAARLDELTATRQNIISMADRARDYMDWFEITRARETSGAFDDYLRLKQQLREGPKSLRNDPVTHMLDRFDTIFHRETNTRPNWNDVGWQNPLLLPQR
jgi:hypothetical protein